MYLVVGCFLSLLFACGNCRWSRLSSCWRFYCRIPGAAAAFAAGIDCRCCCCCCCLLHTPDTYLTDTLSICTCTACTSIHLAAHALASAAGSCCTCYCYRCCYRCCCCCCCCQCNPHIFRKNAKNAKRAISIGERTVSVSVVNVSVSVCVSCIFCLFDMLWLYLFFLCTISGFPFTTCQLTFQATNTQAHTLAHTHTHTHREAGTTKTIAFYFVIIKFVCCCSTRVVQVEFSFFLTPKIVYSFSSRFLGFFVTFWRRWNVVGQRQRANWFQLDQRCRTTNAFMSASTWLSYR